ncbi:MAG: 50S ribosomal protein L9 [Spirochaetia bacterium]|jgi:large subunit ribosomal protein L9|nr:50S ribosomal protein L9 [Spirochaetia bacterium]
MKVILNNDVPELGELGDVKDVAAGYARNYLLPRGLVYAYSPASVAMFEKRKAEIEARKAEKRASSSDLRTRLEADEIIFDMPAGQNGKLFGAVSNASIADELLKKGIQIDRKKIEVPGRVIKSVGNYKIMVRLYEKEEATVRISVKGHVEKAKQSAPAPEQARRRRHEERDEKAAPVEQKATETAPQAASEAAQD